MNEDLDDVSREQAYENVRTGVWSFETFEEWCFAKEREATNDAFHFHFNVETDE